MLLDCFCKQSRRRHQHDEDPEQKQKQEQQEIKLPKQQDISRNSVQPIMSETSNMSRPSSQQQQRRKKCSDHGKEMDNCVFNGTVFENRDERVKDQNALVEDNFKNIFYGTPGTTPVLFFSNGLPRNVQTWGESLDKLLEDPIGIQTFFMHLKAEHSTENIRFWLACENYKKCTQDTMKETANQIYNEFLSRRASSQINVACSLLREVRKDVSKPSSATFLKVQHEIFNLMRTDSYPRFLKSGKYNSLLNAETSPS